MDQTNIKLKFRSLFFVNACDFITKKKQNKQVRAKNYDNKILESISY